MENIHFIYFFLKTPSSLLKYRKACNLRLENGWKWKLSLGRQLD